MRRKFFTSLLDWVTWFSVHLGNSFFVLKPTTLFTKCPWFYIYFIIYSIIPVNSSLNAKTAEAAPNSRVTRPPKTSFGPRFQIRPFSDSLMFWVFSCKHFAKGCITQRNRYWSNSVPYNWGEPCFFFVCVSKVWNVFFTVSLKFRKRLPIIFSWFNLVACNLVRFHLVVILKQNVNL